MGWDNNVHVPVHTQVREQAVIFHHQLLLRWGGVGWAGVGWDNNVHVPAHTHRHDNRHCSFIISYCWGGVGVGGIITFMFLYTHRHGKLIIFLSANNVHVPVHIQAPQQATSTATN